MPKYAFRFISGKYQGGEFPIPDEGELVIGRASELDMVLVEDMVSRKHAKLLAQNGALSLQDLGSTNGTYVNGEKIKRRDLKLNDRVLIGTSIVKVIGGGGLSDASAQASDKEALHAMMNALANRAPPDSAMSGDLEEVPLPDLLLLFATNKKTGILSVTGHLRGRLYLKAGQLHYAVIGGETTMRPMKALCRMLLWQKGAFHFEATEDVDVPQMFEASTESVLIDAARQNDESRRVLPELPTMDTRLQLTVPMTPRLAELKAAELDTLQLVHNLGVMRTVLDKCPATDFEVLTHLRKLLRSGYIQPA